MAPTLRSSRRASTKFINFQYIPSCLYLSHLHCFFSTLLVLSGYLYPRDITEREGKRRDIDLLSRSLSLNCCENICIYTLASIARLVTTWGKRNIPWSVRLIYRYVFARHSVRVFEKKLRGTFIQTAALHSLCYGCLHTCILFEKNCATD